MQFPNWMRLQKNQRTGEVLKSGKKYVGALYGRVSEIARAEGICENVAAIECPEELEVVMRQLLDNPRFLEADRRNTKAAAGEKSGNSMYSNALKWYARFLREGIMIDDVAEDRLEVVQRTGIAETEKERLIRARVGQGDYRWELMRIWNCTCPASGVTDPRFLVASHIKPWRESTDAERLDARNGLLLATNYDRAFDLGLITFAAGSGKILFSNSIMPEAPRLGLSDLVVIPNLPEVTSEYLKYHQKNIFLGRN